MGEQANYGGVIWTKHALERLGKRGLTQELAWQAFNHPDEEKEGKTARAHEFRKRIGKSTVTVIAKQNERREWLILSVWVKPPLTGWAMKQEKEFQNFRQAGFWGKLWYTAKKQLGL